MSDMKLSEAIRLGGMLKPQIRGQFFNAVIPADDVSELDAKVLQARMAFAAKVGRN